MSIYKGTTLLSGVATNTISNAHTLLDYKWTDHIISSMEWLRSDTFSWQSGAVYVAAYNHLVADYQGGTSQTETVGSYTITYVLATDGHKITTDETTVANIYNESGVAWYYVLDTTNQRFKLPRENPAREELIQIIRAKGNGITLGLTDGTNNLGLQNGSNPYKAEVASGSYNKNVGTASVPNSSNVVTLGITTDSTKSGIISDMTESTSVYKGKQYLYFYVGQFSQSATEQTAGLNSGMFNEKMDLDAGNATSAAITNLLNLANSTDKQLVNGWGIPDYTAGVAISTGYVAVSNGMVKIVRGGGSWGVSLRVDGVVVDGNYSNTTNEGGCLIAFVKKGSTVTWDTGNISDTPTFFPCVGG